MVTFDLSQFHERFPAFVDDVAIVTQWEIATYHISADEYGDLGTSARALALQLMTAHLLAVGAAVAAQSAPGVVVQSKVGDVSVSLAPPPYGTSPWRYWLNLTPYGGQLLALLDARAAGGFYVGGLPERAAFRKVGGVF